MKTLIAPSILSADFGNLAKQINEIDKAGADLVHIDVMDGVFVPNITIGPLIVDAVKQATKLPLDVHLMITNPDNSLEMFAKAGADIISVHSEACIHLHRTLQTIRAFGIRAGVAYNPATPVDTLLPVLDLVDQVVIMSVNPGFGGQSFIPAVLPKIEAVKEMIDKSGYSIDIQVDGGVSPDTAAIIKKAGANVLVAGSAVFGSSDYANAIETIRTV